MKKIEFTFVQLGSDKIGTLIGCIVMPIGSIIRFNNSDYEVCSHFLDSDNFSLILFVKEL